MRLAVLSDLHVEFEDFTPPHALQEADVVVLAGDIENGTAALHWARSAFPRQRIVQIAGNHEFFGGTWQTVLAEMRETARQLDIHFLENDSVDLDGVRFYGATMWSDFQLFTVPGRPLSMSPLEAMALMQRRMIDFSAVSWQPHPALEPRTIAPSDTVELHRASRKWLEARLREPFDGPRVVITHHLPSWRSVAPAFLRAASNAAFASDLDDLIERCTLWIHGHTHHSFDYRAGSARVVANPRGYPQKDGEDENPAFDPSLIVTV